MLQAVFLLLIGMAAALRSFAQDGEEPETVDAIAAWMLGKPFQKEIR